MTALTREDLDNIKYIASLSPSWEEHELDFSDDRQWAHFMGQVARSGVNEETHPEYMKALNLAREEDQKRGGPSGLLELRRKDVAAAGDTMQDANTISSFGINVAKTATLGAAFSAIVNGTTFTSLYVQLIDLSDDDKVLGENSIGPIYGEGEYLPIDLTGSVPMKEDMLMVFTWSYQPKVGVPPVQGSMRVSTSELPVGAPIVTEPLRTKTNNYIKIGLGRPAGAPDCDYWYNEPNIQAPNIRLPLKVSQTFASNIKQPAVAVKHHQSADDLPNQDVHRRRHQANLVGCYHRGNHRHWRHPDVQLPIQQQREPRQIDPVRRRRLGQRHHAAYHDLARRQD